MTIAAKHLDPLVGVDVHIVLIPSPGGPIPTPLPHPYVGMVLDPFDYLPKLGASVLINGLPRATAGTGGIALPPHIPMGGPFAKPPTNESEIFMGSSTVLVDGNPQSRLGLPVLSCQDIGLPAPPRPKKLAFPKSLLLPTTVVLSPPMGPPVLIGGTPTVSLSTLLMRGLLAGLKKLRRLKRISDRLAALSSKLRQKASRLCDHLGLGDTARNLIAKAICTVTGHPVDVATGKVFTEQVDFEMLGPLPLKWERTWYSTSTYEGPLGHGWHHSLDAALHVTSDVLLLRAPDGRHLPLPPLDDGAEYFDRKEKLTVRRNRNEYSVRDAEGLTHVFAGTGSVRRLARIEDSVGNQVLLTHDQAGRLTEVVDSGGRDFTLHYQDGLLSRIEGPHPEDPQARIVLVRYEYDDRGNLAFVYDALDQRTRYEYKTHLLVRETNRNGLSFYFEYDGTNHKTRCTRTWGDGGIYNHRLTYGASITVVENSLGHKTTYHHDGGLVWKTVDALGAEQVTERNDWNEVIKEIDPLDQITESRRDERGNLIEEEAPDGAVAKFGYDERDRPVRMEGPAGGEWTWRYDDAGRLVERIDALGARTTFQWHGPRLVGVTDPAGHHTKLDYDSDGNLIGLQAPDGAHSRWEYDRLGRCVRAIDPAGNVETRRLDPLGRITQVEEPDGNLRDIAYDGEGNIVRAKDQQYDVAFQYGGMNRLLARKQAGTVVRFTYDTEEQLTALTNELGTAYRFVRGPTGEVDEEQDFDGLSRRYGRDKAGRVKTVTRPTGLVSEYGYDLAGRVIRVKHTNRFGKARGKEQYKYRSDGELIAADNGTCVVKLKRDLLGRVINEQQGAHSVESEYGPLGLRARMSTSLGHALEIERNEVGDVLALRAGGGPAVTSRNDAQNAPAPSWEATFTRDQLGLEVERHLPGGVRGRWERDRLGRPVKHELWSAKKLLNSRAYTWEPNDRLTAIIDSLRGPIAFTHDGLGNLTSAARKDGKIDLRMPDAVGNLFRTNDQQDRIYGPSGQLLESRGPDGTIRYVYDLDGNLAAKLLPDGGRWGYEWNAAGMLVRVTRPDGKKVEFGYDALGRRVWKKYQGKTTKWIWDGNVPVHEWVEVDPATLSTPKPSPATQNNVVAKQRGVDLAKRTAQGPPSATTWIFEPESFAPIAKLSGTDHHSIITDHLGTPRTMLDSAGAAVWSAEIGIYGELNDVVGDKHACPFRWPGQYEDEETGLYYNRFRYYDPEAGEYLSQDPIGLAGGFAVYSYVHDTAAWTDPFGLAGCGQLGERIARRRLKQLGYTVLGEVKNKSGHGIDVVARSPGGRLTFVEVKTTSIGRAPRLSADQLKGSASYAESRLGRASAAKGPWTSVHDSKTASLAKAWLKEHLIKGSEGRLLNVDLVTRTITESIW